MKRTLLLLVVGAVIGGGTVWLVYRAGVSTPEAEKPAAEEEQKTTISHDTNGNVVITMTDEAKDEAGIVVENPAAAQFTPELQGYGKVLDPTPLAVLVSELGTAQATYAASSKELARLKSLAPQGNASTRAVQTADAAALHDQLTIQSVRDRLVLSWGRAVAEQRDLPAFTDALVAQEAALVRIDLPAGERLKSPPTGARVVALSGDSTEAEFLGPVPGVDPQSQGRGFIFLSKPNALRLAPGQGVTGYLKLPGEPVSGVIVPGEAVVRAEGKGWIYVLNEGGDSFTRKEIALDRPTATGWFVTSPVTAGDHVVVTGAQTLLSEELKATIKPD